MAKKRKRKRYTDAQRTQILAVAKKEGLTAAAVEKRFGVKQITYYSWRKKTGAAKRSGRIARRGRRVALGGALRSEVQNRLRTMLPEIVREEVDRYLNVALGAKGRG